MNAVSTATSSSSAADPQQGTLSRDVRRALDESGIDSTDTATVAARVADVVASAGSVDEVTARLQALSAADIAWLTGDMSLTARTRLANLCEVRLDPRYVRSGFARALVPGIRRLAARRPMDVSLALVVAAVDERFEAILDDVTAATADQILGVAQMVMADGVPESVVAAYLATVAASDLPTAVAASEALARHDGT